MSKLNMPETTLQHKKITGTTAHVHTVKHTECLNSNPSGGCLWSVRVLGGTY